MDNIKKIADDIDEFDQSTIECNKCHEDCVFLPRETWWNEQGTYSVKLTKCSCCGAINPIKYIDASGLYVNDDRKYYR